MSAAPVLAGGLAVTSVLLAGPVSAMLARSTWMPRAPRAALLLWQAVCLAAGLGMISAGVVLALEPLGGNIVDGTQRWLGRVGDGQPLVGLTVDGILTGTLAAAAALILFGVLLRSIVLTTRRRRDHRLLLDLLTAGRRPVAAAARPDLLVDIRVLDHATAVAYTLPGWHSRVVLSAGMLDLLTHTELVAVIDHEKAHVRSRHDLLVLPFQAWGTALGWLPGVRAAAESVAELTEMLADDWAARRSKPSTLAKALATVALSGVPAGSGVVGSQTPAVTGRSAAARVNRLLHPDPLPLWALSCVYLAALLLVLLPLAAVFVDWH